MEYTTAQLAKISGVTARTLRYYDQIGLLCPKRISNGYRVYGQKEVDTLQQILLYRELGVELAQIKAVVQNPRFCARQALEEHLLQLLERKNNLDTLIANVTKTINTMKGESDMSDEEKFEGLKKKYIAENEKLYGKEIREKYGEDAVNCFYNRFKGLGKEKLEHARELEKEIEELLKEGVSKNLSPESRQAKKLFEAHREWLCVFWPQGMYTKAAHRQMADMYLQDKRFSDFYDKTAVGGAKFLHDAIYAACDE